MFDEKIMRINRIFILLLCMLCIFGCSRVDGSIGPEQEKPAENVNMAAEDEALEAVDTVILISVDTEEKQIILQNSQSGTRYQLDYDGKTCFYDKYEQMLTAMQLQAGDIADVIISVHSGYLKELRMNPDTFVVRDTKEHVFNENKRMLTVGADNYKLPQRLVVIQNGRVGGISDINENDVITIRGIDRTVLSCNVERGHGYLKLRGEDTFLGGWLEIGSIIKPISEKMLLLVPEGTYDMRITYHGRGGSLSVTIEKDKETTVDVSSLKDEILQTGEVKFNIQPHGATLRINGEKTDYILPVELEYGVYQINVTADGYTPLKEYLSVGKEEAEIEIELMEETAETEKSKSSSQSNAIDYVVPSRTKESSASSSAAATAAASPIIDTGSSSSEKSSSESVKEAEADETEEEMDGEDNKKTDARVYVEEPEAVEVYYDGHYKGMSPISFRKYSGTHVISLRKDGYITKSYTESFDYDDKDEYLSYDELQEE